MYLVLVYCDNKNKKAQLSLTNPRDACDKFSRFTEEQYVVSCIASLPIDSVPIVYYYIIYSNSQIHGLQTGRHTGRKNQTCLILAIGVTTRSMCKRSCDRCDNRSQVYGR